MDLQSRLPTSITDVRLLPLPFHSNHMSPFPLTSSTLFLLLFDSLFLLFFDSILNFSQLTEFFLSESAQFVNFLSILLQFSPSLSTFLSSITFPLSFSLSLVFSLPHPLSLFPSFPLILSLFSACLFFSFLLFMSSPFFCLSLLLSLSLFLSLLLFISSPISLGKEWDSERKEWIIYDLKHEADTILNMTPEEYLASLTGHGAYVIFVLHIRTLIFLCFYDVLKCFALTLYELLPYLNQFPSSHFIIILFVLSYFGMFFSISCFSFLLSLT